MEPRRRAKDRTFRDVLEILPPGHRGHEFYVGRPTVPPEPKDVIWKKPKNT